MLNQESKSWWDIQFKMWMCGFSSIPLLFNNHLLDYWNLCINTQRTEKEFQHQTPHHFFPVESCPQEHIPATCRQHQAHLKHVVTRSPALEGGKHTHTQTLALALPVHVGGRGGWKKAAIAAGRISSINVHREWGVRSKQHQRTSSCPWAPVTACPPVCTVTLCQLSLRASLHDQHWLTG